jgi:hypothetical protein
MSLKTENSRRVAKSRPVCMALYAGEIDSPIPQNTTQKSISIVFSVSAIRHDSSLSKYRKQKQSPPGNTKNGERPGG